MLDVVKKLDRSGIAYMLTGSMAANIYTMPRMTRDIDFVVAITPQDVKRLSDVFPDDEYYLSLDAALDAAIRRSSFNLIHLETLVKVDFMIQKSEEYRVVEFARKSAIAIQGVTVWVASKEDLILSKLDWARESHSDIQLLDVKNLLSTGYDKDYLTEWTEKLQLSDMLTRVLA